MNVTVKDKSNNKNEYPYLGISKNENIVLFIFPRQGTCISSKKGHYLGEYCETWVEEEFKPYEGEIVLSNG